MLQNLFLKIIKIFVIFIFFVNFFSCNNNQDPIPYEYVDFTIDLNKPDYFDLKVPGNYINVTGGYRGIIIYRSSIDEFKAYERTCTYDINCRVDVDEYAMNMVDSCCGSQFSLGLDGVVSKGPATLPLRQYKTIYFPNSNTLRITN